MVRLIPVLLLVFSSGVLAQQTSNGNPHKFFEGFVEHMESLLNTVAVNHQFFTDNTQLLESLVESHVNSYIDYEGISQFVVGKHWRWATDKEKSAFIVEFRRELMRSYSSFVLKYSNDPIEWGYAYKARKDHMLVTAELGKEKLSFYFRKRSYHDNNWMLHDIKIGGISIMSTYRSAYRRILQESGRSADRKSIKTLTRTIKRRNNARSN